MSINPPHVSIIMATYNRSHLIMETLRSIVNQSFENWECLIIDDGSTDDTREILRPLLSKDSRFHLYSRTSGHKKGLPGSRNMGIDLAKGKYFIFFDDDDIVHPENLQFCINLLKNDQFYFVRYAKKPFTGNSSEIEFKKIKDHTLVQFGIQSLDDMVTGKIPFASCNVMWDRVCFDKNRFKEELLYAEEWECYSRILSSGIRGLSTDAILYFNRKHEHSNTGEYRRKKSVRIKSHEEAACMIISTLSVKNLFNKKLKGYFLRMGFELHSFRVIQGALDAANSGLLEKQKYKIGYKIYPLLKPLFYLKGKIKKY